MFVRDRSVKPGFDQSGSSLEASQASREINVTSFCESIILQQALSCRRGFVNLYLDLSIFVFDD